MQCADDRKHRADEHGLGARVRAVVHARRVTARLVERDHPERGRERTAERDHADHRDRGAWLEPTSSEPQRPEDHGRPDQIELLLDRERPEVQQRRRCGEGAEVRLTREDEVPVDDVPQRRQDVDPELVETERWRQHRGVHQDGAEHHEQRGEEPPRPAGPEAREIDAGRPVPLADQQPGDEEARQHEEGVEREDTARSEVPGVHRDREPDGEPPPAVERGPVGASCRRGGARAHLAAPCRLRLTRTSAVVDQSGVVHRNLRSRG